MSVLPIDPQPNADDIPDDAELIAQWRKDSDFIGRLASLPLATLFVIVLLTVAHFLVIQLAGGDPDRALYYILVGGAKVNPLIDRGEWWRLISAAFLHVSFVHLTVSCLGLLLLGWFVESTLGRRAVLLVFLLSGAAGSLLSYLLSDIPSVGASGAMFGMLGATIGYALVRWKQIPRFVRSYLVGLPATVGIVSIGYGLFAGNVDNYSHLGGAIAGVLMGLLIPRVDTTSSITLKASWSLLQAMGVLLFAFTLSAMIGRFDLRFDVPQWDLQVGLTSQDKAYFYPVDWKQGVFEEGKCMVGTVDDNTEGIRCYVDPFFTMLLVAPSDEMHSTPLYQETEKAANDPDAEVLYGNDQVLWASDPLRRLDFALVVFEPLSKHYQPLFGALQMNPESARSMLEK